MQRDSNDIDIALDNMHGTEFAHLVQQQYNAFERSHNYHDGAISRAAIIQANPDKSKHLETATLRVFGLDVDFVNLRAEDYTADSRIPQMVQ